MKKNGIIETKAYARAGLIGNPSDGFGGKTISFPIKNYQATVHLWESPTFHIVPGEEDRFEFSSDHDFLNYVNRNGYYGGLRLIAAAIKVFDDYCKEKDVSLNPRNYSIQYSTTIPRQKGLSGSSAIITATIRALMEYHQVDIPKEKQPNIILSAEKKELGIAAGLQDRVVQVYEDLVYMDFSNVKDTLRDQGRYIVLDKNKLPPVFVAYINDGSEESGKVHNRVTELFAEGDRTIVYAMRHFAELTEKAKAVIEYDGYGDRKWQELGKLMDLNFDTRRSIYNLRASDIEMIQIARDIGAHAKFAGSSGAAVGTYRDQAMFDELNEAYNKHDITLIKPEY